MRKGTTAFLSVNFLQIISYAAVSSQEITSLARIPVVRASHSPVTTLLSPYQRRNGLLRDIIVRRGIVLHHFAILHVDPMTNAVNLGTERKLRWQLSHLHREGCHRDEAVFTKMRPLQCVP